MKKGIIYNVVNHLLWFTVNQIINSIEYCCSGIGCPWIFGRGLFDIKNNKRNYWYVILLRQVLKMSLKQLIIMMITLMYTHIPILKVWKDCKMLTNGFYLKRKDKDKDLPIKWVAVKQDLWVVSEWAMEKRNILRMLQVKG